jgi:hypothetical protein
MTTDKGSRYGVRMFEDISKRDLAAIASALIVVCALSAWGSIFVIKKYILGDRADPLARAGGLNLQQSIQVK